MSDIYFLEIGIFIKLLLFNKKFLSDYIMKLVFNVYCVV